MYRKALPVRIAVFSVAALTLTVLSFAIARNHQKTVNHGNLTHAASAAVNQPTQGLQKPELDNAYGKLPMAFEPNQGQADPRVRYLSHGTGYGLFLTNQEAVLTLQQRQAAGAKADNSALLASRRKTRSVVKTSVLRMRFEGSSSTPEIAGTNPLPGKINYFIGNDPTKWHTDIPSYGAVRYKGVYPGVDAVFYGNQQRLEYDFVVAPGADPKAIVLNIEGARKLGVNPRGDLMMSVARGAVALQKPVVYQEINGERREIAGNYVIADHNVRFSLADYDRTQPLTIDPVLNYSTYIGGEALDTADGIALDAAGDAYIAGSTTSTTFPQMNAEAGTPADIALGTAFVSELNPTGSALVYSSYIGGSGNGSFGEGAQAVAVDTATPPNIYITGFTGSPDFPVSTTLAPLQGQPGPASTATGGSAFITKLNPGATGVAQLVYSSYLGGDTFDEGFGIAVDAAGHAFIAGETVFTSTKFPTKGTQILATPSMVGNAFLTEFDTTASGAASLVYSTYLGGSGAGSSYLFGFGDIAFGVTIDTNSNAYVVGGTSSTDFPTNGTAIPGSAACGANTISSAFISVINTTAGTLGYSQCLSGSAKEEAVGVSLGTGVPAVTTKVAYITGQTYSPNFPVTANTIPVAGGSEASGVAFVSLVNTNSTTPLQYSTFLGGNASDVGNSIASDALGNAYVAGSTGSSDFPVTPGALQTTNNNPAGTAFVSKIGPNGLGLADLIYSTYYGGQATTTPAPATADLGLGIAVSGTNAYITGQMSASNMLVSSTAVQKMLGAAGATANAFVADLPMVAGITVSPTSINFGTQAIGVATAPQTVTVTNNTTSTVTFTSITVVPISPAAPATDFAIASNTCGTSIAAATTCTVGVTFTPSVNAAESATLVFTDSDPSSPQNVALSGTGSNTISAITINPTSLTFAGQLLTTTSAAKSITLSNPSMVALSISAIASTNSDFTIASNSCGSTFPITIAPSGTPCTLMVTFNPASSTAPGADTGSITITDNANGSPQSVSLTGTAWDFSLTGPSGAVSVTSGVATTFPVTVNGLGGFTGTVALTCAGSANVTTCTVTPSSSGPGMVSVSVTATNKSMVQPSLRTPPAASIRQVAFVVLGIGMLFMIPMTRRFRTRLGLAGAMLVFVVLAGCAGHGHKPVAGTATITGTSGGVTKTVTVNLNIT